MAQVLHDNARNPYWSARKQLSSQEMLLWMTPSQAPKALQAQECCESELLDPPNTSIEPGTFRSSV